MYRLSVSQLDSRRTKGIPKESQSMDNSVMKLNLYATSAR